MTEQKVIKTTHRIIKPHATIANISYHLEKHANENESGSTLFRMAGLVMEAFFVEGYSAVVAENMEKSDELLATSGTKERVKAIFKAADPDADFGKRPYQSITKLLRFRDNMAHPKVEELRQEVELTIDEATDSIENITWNLTTESEQFCAAENSSQIREDVLEVLKRTWREEWEGSPLDSGMQMVSHEPKNRSML